MRKRRKNLGAENSAPKGARPSQPQTIALQISYAEQKPSYVSLRIEAADPGSRHSNMTASRSLHQIMIRDAQAELKRISERYEAIEALRPVWRAAEQILARLNAPERKSNGEDGNEANDH
jgi:hypothetical protein